MTTKTKSLLFLLFFTILSLTIFLAAKGNVFALLQPQGIIAAAEKHLLLTATAFMMVVIVPVFLLALYMSVTYRAENTKARYMPHWDHNAIDEAIWWAVPFIIIVILSVLAWRTSHDLDPWKPIEHSGQALQVEVVALDWKWLFIYPQQNIATVNEMYIPVGVPIEFSITADAPMNSFWIPQLGGQIYAMAGMTTKLHLIADHEGVYDGLSANFSGKGFSGMKFKVHAVSENEFTAWITRVSSSEKTLYHAQYVELSKPSEYVPVTYFGSYDDGLFSSIVNKYMRPGGDRM